jgi:hypothetical protein
LAALLPGGQFTFDVDAFCFRLETVFFCFKEQFVIDNVQQRYSDRDPIFEM